MEYFRCFNTQPPEGGWLQFGNATAIEFGVSTHSRPKAAGVCAYRNYGRVDSFNTQPPEGGWAPRKSGAPNWRGFNTQPPEGGWGCCNFLLCGFLKFQHTAARRRLGAHSHRPIRINLVSTHSRPKAAGILPTGAVLIVDVSTHSRPKAAGAGRLWGVQFNRCFNTQPPEGGWGKLGLLTTARSCFNTQPPEGGWHAFFTVLTRS